MATYEAGAACRPNFSAAGRRQRLRAAQAGAALAVVFFGTAVALDVSWPLRLLVGLPAAAAFISGLQIRRNTCVAHAATGRFENDDMSTTPAEAASAEASRNVARTIWRDGIAMTVMVSVAAAATAFL